VLGFFGQLDAYFFVLMTQVQSPKSLRVCMFRVSDADEAGESRDALMEQFVGWSLA
jgi:hypothetical protein